MGWKGNLRFPDRQRLFFPDNIELGKKGGTGNHCLCFSHYFLENGRVPTSERDTVTWQNWRRHYKSHRFIFCFSVENLLTNQQFSTTNKCSVTSLSRKAEVTLSVVIFQSLVFDSNKAFALAGVGAPLSLHQYVKKMSCLRAGLPNTWKTTSEPRKTDHRGSAKRRFSQVSLSELWKLYSCVRVGKFYVHKQSATSPDQSAAA